MLLSLLLHLLGTFLVVWLWLFLLSGASRQVENACGCIALIAATNICTTSNRHYTPPLLFPLPPFSSTCQPIVCVFAPVFRSCSLVSLINALVAVNNIVRVFPITCCFCYIVFCFSFFFFLTLFCLFRFSFRFRLSDLSCSLKIHLSNFFKGNFLRFRCIFTKLQQAT